MNHFQLLTFDLDDTLWPLPAVLKQAEQACYQWLCEQQPAFAASYSLRQLHDLKADVLATAPELKHQISKLRIHTLNKALLNSGLSAAQATDYSQQAFDVFHDYRNRVTFYPNAEACMQRLKSEYQLAALTNGNACLTKAGASHWFDFLISAEQINASKPAPDHFLKAMERSNTPANRVIHIGDHPDNDIRAASSLGIQTVWANLEKLDWPGADQPKYQITDLAELPAVIKNLESAMTH